jgi:hypothetical protein
LSGEGERSGLESGLRPWNPQRCRHWSARSRWRESGGP